MKDIGLTDDALGRAEIMIDNEWIEQEKKGEEFWITLVKGDIGKEVGEGMRYIRYRHILSRLHS